MLTIQGPRYNGFKDGFCDGVSRRGFLRVGALGGLGTASALSLPQLLRAESEARTGSSRKSIIMVFLPGGPPHQDMWDIKMDAPSEYRGPFRPIGTNVAGIQIGELFPRIAAMADRFAFIRSMVGASGGHDAHQCLTGRSKKNAPIGGWPSLGSVLSKLDSQLDSQQQERAGSTKAGTPAFVGLSPKTKHFPWCDSGQPGYLGPSYAPFQPNKTGGGDDLTLKGITLDRLSDRKGLLTSFDNFRRGTDASGIMDGMDEYTQQAFGVLTSSQLAEALDCSREDPKLHAAYGGKGDPKPVADGAPRITEHFLAARRLIEAGARCVTLNFSRWDWHSNNFGRARDDFPRLDQAVSTLVRDLEDRGMLDDTTVIVWGEFGRTPKINPKGGRDHWPKVSCALLAGGGMRTGQVIGSTDRLGGEADDRPVTFQEVFATLYHNLGIDVKTATVQDKSGRPRYLVDEGHDPLPELIS